MPNIAVVARAANSARATFASGATSAMRAAPALPMLAALALAGCTPRAGGGGALGAPAAVASPTLSLPRPTGAFAPSSLTSTEIAPGVAHVELTIPGGPWLVHAVLISPAARDVELRTVKGLGHVVGRERPSGMARRTAAVEGREVLAAVNADFFNFTPPGVSEGPQVSDGRVLKSEDRNRAARADTVLRDQPVFGVAADGQPFFADAHLEGGVGLAGDAPLTLLRVNRDPDSDSLTLYNSYMGDSTPGDDGATELVLRTVRAAAMAGDTAVGVVVEIDTAAAGVPIPDDGAVLALPTRPGVAVGDTVRWWLPFSGAPPRVRELVGGYPMLLRDGRRVFESSEAIIPGFSEKQHPRTAVATLADGSTILLAVDGRSETSKGMSLDELADFLTALGAVDALNLDGGGSTVMIVRDSIVSHPSDREGERAVANALVLLGRAAGSDR